MSYDSTILAEANLVAYYKLNETSGTSAADSSSNAFNGTITGTVTLNQTNLAAGLDPCMLLDGSTGYILLPTGPNVAEPFSIEMWIKDNGITGDGFLFSNHFQAGVGFQWQQTNSNKAYVYGANGAYNTTNAFSSGSVYYVALTVDTSSNYAINVGKVGTDSAPTQWGTGNPGAGPTYSGGSNIGRESDGTRYFKGFVSSVAIYSKVLVQGTMNNHYTVGTTAPSANKVFITDGLGGVFT